MNKSIPLHIRVGAKFMEAAFTPEHHDEAMDAEDWMAMACWMLGFDQRAVMDCSREGIIGVI